MSVKDADINPLAVSVLSLLDERDMHPYEMIQTLRARREDQWVKVSTGSLYHQIERLVACELAKPVGTEQDGNRPPRTIYRITTKGHGVLARWIAVHLTLVENPYLAVSLALGELATLPPDEAATLLTARKAALAQALAELEESLELAKSQGAERIWLLAHEHKIALLKTERDFVAALVTDIEKKELEWPTQP